MTWRFAGGVLACQQLTLTSPTTNSQRDTRHGLSTGLGSKPARQGRCGSTYGTRHMSRSGRRLTGQTVIRTDGDRPVRPAKPRKRGKPDEQKRWERTRKAHLTLYPECRVCGTLDNPNVHHVKYRKKGAERPGDLITLCQPHHAEFHVWHRKTRGYATSVDGTLAFIEMKVHELYAVGAD